MLPVLSFSATSLDGFRDGWTFMGVKVTIHHRDEDLVLDVPSHVADMIVDAWRSVRDGPVPEVPDGAVGEGGELLVDSKFLAEAKAVTVGVGDERSSGGLVLLVRMRVRGPDLDMPDAAEQVAEEVTRFWQTVGDHDVEYEPVSGTEMFVHCRVLVVAPVAWPALCWMVMQARLAAERDAYGVGCVVDDHAVDIDAA